MPIFAQSEKQGRRRSAYVRRTNKALRGKFCVLNIYSRRARYGAIDRVIRVMLPLQFVCSIFAGWPMAVGAPYGSGSGQCPLQHSDAVPSIQLNNLLPQ